MFVHCEEEPETLRLQSLMQYPTNLLSAELAKHNAIADTIKMAICSMLQILKSQEHTITQIFYNDELYKQRIGTSCVYLGLYSFMKDGFAWYERQLGATSIKKDEIEAIRKCLYHEPDTTRFDRLDIYFGDDLENIKSLCSKSTTWLEFMNFIEKNYNCTFLYEHIYYFTMAMYIDASPVTDDFLIPIDSIAVYECEIIAIIKNCKLTHKQKNYTYRRNVKSWPLGKDSISDISDFF